MGFRLQLEPHFRVFEAKNGQEALDQIDKEAPGFFSVVLLDMNMPVMGGIETAQLINQRYENCYHLHPRLYFLSADAMPISQLAGINFVDFF